MANTLAYHDTVTITVVKSFFVQAPEANPIYKFWGKVTLSFCKLDHFSIKGQMLYNSKTVCIVKRGSNFRPISFIGLAPGSNTYLLKGQ